MTQLRPHKGRRVTDEQIRTLRAFVPFQGRTLAQLAESLGISVGHAKKLRYGTKQHKTACP